MRQAAVYRNGELAGYLIEEGRQQYLFRYDERWLADPHKPAISLTLPKTQSEYRSDALFPFFSNMLSEGVNRRLQSVQLRVDEADIKPIPRDVKKTDNSTEAHNRIGRVPHPLRRQPHQPGHKHR